MNSASRKAEYLRTRFTVGRNREADIFYISMVKQKFSENEESSAGELIVETNIYLHSD